MLISIDITIYISITIYSRLAIFCCSNLSSCARTLKREESIRKTHTVDRLYIYIGSTRTCLPHSRQVAYLYRSLSIERSIRLSIPGLRSSAAAACRAARAPKKQGGRRVCQPTQRAANYTERSIIEPAQRFPHANGQSAPRPNGDRYGGRGAGHHTLSTTSESVLARRVVHGSRSISGSIYLSIYIWITIYSGFAIFCCSSLSSCART